MSLIWKGTLSVNTDFLYECCTDHSTLTHNYGYHIRLLLPQLKERFVDFLQYGMRNCWHTRLGIEPKQNSAPSELPLTIFQPCLG